MNIILFDDSENRKCLLPFTFTRPTCEIRIGITTIRQKWEHNLHTLVSTLTEPYLQKKFLLVESVDNIYIDGSFIPNPIWVEKILSLANGESIYYNDTLVAFRNSSFDYCNCSQKSFSDEILRINQLTDIFSNNEAMLLADFNLLTYGRKSAALSQSNKLIGNPACLFIEEGARIEGAIINCNEGPVYIDKGAEIMEGALIRGPFALCDHSTIKMGAKVYGATTIGPHCKVGGEVSNVVFFGYSNKAHDGFLGNSVIGEWCNLGADTNSSNLKNNYSEIKLWSYDKERFVKTGTRFCGLMMGDHSKCGITTMFNSGTVVGVACNLYGTGYHRNFIPSFSFGGPKDGYTDYHFNKVIETAQIVFSRRHKIFDDTEQELLKSVYDLTSK